MKIIVFDIEVLKNAFLCCNYDTETKQIHRFEISNRKNDLKELVDYFNQPGLIFAGYNCDHYDAPIIQHLINDYYRLSTKSYTTLTNECYTISNNIIGSERFPYMKLKYDRKFRTIDLMTMMASKALRVGLKPLQVTMCYKNVKESSIDWKKEILDSQLDELIYYCDNDVMSTYNLLGLLKNDLSLRLKIQQDFNINCLSKDGVGIGVDIFTKYVCEKLNISHKDLISKRDNIDIIYVKDYITPAVKFKTEKLNQVLDWYKSLVLDSEGFLNGTSPTGSVIINNLEHSYGIGGLHSVNQPKVYVSCSKFIIRDKDVTGYYPSLSEEWGFGPKGFKDAFVSVIKFLKASRVIAKKAKDKAKDSTYKLALNSILGHLRNKFGPYYAPEANVGICVNGQLFLLMLIEECELQGIECISSNTDGATFKIPVEKEQLFEQICSDWEKTTRMGLEAVDYEKLVIVAVNDYVAFKKGFSEIKDKIKFPKVTDWIEYNYTYLKTTEDANLISEYVKFKGMFIPHLRLGKGLDSLIISKALINYFGMGIPIKETIISSTDIWDFMMFQKVGKQYTVYWRNQIQQHINRFYASKKGSAYLFKVKPVKKVSKQGKIIDVESVQNLLTGSGVELFNEFQNKLFHDYNINYNYYFSRTNEIITSLEPTQLNLF